MKKIYIILALIIPSFLCANSFAQKAATIYVVNNTQVSNNKDQRDQVELHFNNSNILSKREWLNKGENTIQITQNRNNNLQKVFLIKTFSAYFKGKNYDDNNKVKTYLVECKIDPSSMNNNMQALSNTKVYTFSKANPDANNFGTYNNPLANNKIGYYKQTRNFNGWNCHIIAGPGV